MTVEFEGPVPGCGCALCTALSGASSVAADGSDLQPAALTGTSYIDALLPSTTPRWTGTIGTAATVTYSFMTAVPSYYSSSATERTNFVALSEAQRAGARRALTMWSEVANLSFQEVSDSGSGGQVRFGTALLTSGVGAWAYYPNSSDSRGGDVWISNRYSNNLIQTDGSYGYLTMMHELGHALGLKHPGNYNAGGGGTDGPYLPTSEDNRQYSIMSYYGHPSSQVEPRTAMLYDIAAIQYLYGANTSTRSGDTSYSWNANEAFVQTIWDGGGSDTIDASNHTSNQTIDLRDGRFSSVGSGTNNLAIAFNAVIENANGGSGSDTLIGNSANNVLRGNGGNDTYVFSGRWGSDTVSDNAGSNVITVDAAAGDVTLTRQGRDLAVIRASNGDRVTIENFYNDTTGSAHQTWRLLANGSEVGLELGGTNNPPAVTVTNTQLAAATAVAASTMFTATDPEGGAITQYEFWDSTGTSGSAYFRVGGAGQGAGQTISVAGSALGSVEVVGGNISGTDSLWVRASDGTNWSAWANWSLITTGANRLPTATATGSTIGANASKLASTLFSASDPDGDTISRYEFWDSNGSATSGYFSVAGARQAANTTIAVTASQLASTRFVGGSQTGTDQVWVRVYDGTDWSDWAPWIMTTGGNSAPRATASDRTLPLNTSISAGSLFSLSDAENDTITQYELWDSTAASTSGYFSVAGVRQATNTTIRVTASQMADTTFVAGSAAGTDLLWVRANDGNNWGDWISWTVTSAASGDDYSGNRDTSGAVSVGGTASGQIESAGDDDWFRVQLTAGERYVLTVRGGSGGLAGPQARVYNSSGSLIGTASGGDDTSLSRVYVTPASTGTYYLSARAADDRSTGSYTVSAAQSTNQAPVPGTSNRAVSLNSQTSVDQMVNVVDPDGDTITLYEFWDSTATAGSAYFSVAGVQQGATQVIPVTAAQFSSTVVVGGSQSVSDLMWVRAYDGTTWSEWYSWRVASGSNSAPTVTTTSSSVATGESVRATTLFSVSDIDGDAIAGYEFWDSTATAGSGYFAINGTQQGAGMTIGVDAANINTVTFVGGSATGSDTVWVRASDGTNWSDWIRFTMATTQGTDDYAGDTSTSGTLSVGGSVDAAINVSGDQDWFRVSLTANQRYTFDMQGSSTNHGSLADPYLRLYDSAGTLAASDDDSGTGLDARLSYTPTVTGTYYIGANAYGGFGGGTYRLSMATSGSNSAPVVTAANGTVSAGQSVSVGTLFDVTDPDGDTISQYEFWDSTASTTSGYFAVDGQRQGANVTIPVTASQFASTTFVGGSTQSSDLVWVRAYDGTQWSTWQSWTMSTTGSDDYAGDSSTTGRISVGQSVTGAVDFHGDRDWFAVSLTAGQSYLFDLKGADTGEGSLADPYLRLYSSSSGLLTSDDDSGTGRNSRVRYTATTTGTHYLDVRAYADSGAGSYTLTAASGSAGIGSADFAAFELPGSKKDGLQLAA